MTVASLNRLLMSACGTRSFSTHGGVATNSIAVFVVLSLPIAFTAIGSDKLKELRQSNTYQQQGQSKEAKG